jgi:prevent-host-death family protein
VTIANIHDAKTNLSKLLERVAAGEEVIIARAGKPVARLVPYEERGLPRKPGVWKGKVRIAPDFDELPEAVRKAFKGASD